MKLLFTILLILLSTVVTGQQRIGADINTRLNTLNFTVHYQKVIKGPFLFSAGIGGGYYGHGENWGSKAQIKNGFGFGNAYSDLDNAFADSSSYLLRATKTRGSGITAFVGLGVYKEFANYHGIRVNINTRFSMVNSKVRGSYRDFNTERAIFVTKNIIHPVGAVSLELYHTMRLTGRTTFYWGFKMPYYFSLDNAKFNPKVDSEVFHKLLPDLSIGFTRAIGRCD